MYKQLQCVHHCAILLSDCLQALNPLSDLTWQMLVDGKFSQCIHSSCVLQARNELILLLHSPGSCFSACFPLCLLSVVSAQSP